MFKPWITVPAEDIRIEMPMDRFGDVKIMFRNVSAVDKALEQLENLKELLSSKK